MTKKRLDLLAEEISGNIVNFSNYQLLLSKISLLQFSYLLANLFFILFKDKDDQSRMKVMLEIYKKHIPWNYFNEPRTTILRKIIVNNEEELQKKILILTHSPMTFFSEIDGVDGDYLWNKNEKISD